MPGKSNSFHQVTPFTPRFGVLGANYVSFPVDILSGQAPTAGCLRATPQSSFSGISDGLKVTPASGQYTLENFGVTPLSWAAITSESWIDVSPTLGTLNPGETAIITITFNTGALELEYSSSPYEANVAIVNETNGCGTTEINVFLSTPETIFEQFDGPFVFPENAFKDGNGGYYSTEIIEGENRLHTAAGMQISHLQGTGDIPNLRFLSGEIDGAQRIVWSGASVYNVGTNTFTNTQQAVITESGLFNDGTNWLRGERPERTITAGNNFDELTVEVALNGGYFIFEKSTTGYLDGVSYARRFYSTNSFPDGGFFAGRALGEIWVGGYSMLVEMLDLITPSDMGFPVARTGNPARTQNIVSFDSITDTFTGNMSRAKVNVAIPADKTQMFGTFRFLVTPDDLSQPYSIYVSIDYAVTPSTTYQAIVNFPRIPAASVYYVNGAFSFYPSGYLGFNTFGFTSPIEKTLLPPSSNWPTEISFVNPIVNAGCYDDYEDYTGSDGTVIDINTGYGWAASEFSITIDPTGADDDYESYSDGPAGYLGGGVGWAAYEFTVFKEILDAYDDYETYPDGPAVTIDGGTGWWNGSEFSVIKVILEAYDDFESYSDGPLVLENGGVGWIANGFPVT